MVLNAEKRTLSKLAGFVDFLESNQMLEFSIKGDGENHHVNRMKLQKYVFFARRYGMDLDYECNMYLYGPYSSNLASDYYALADFKDCEKRPLPKTFKKNKFLHDVKNSASWLEIASTLVDMNEGSREDLVSKVCNFKESSFGKTYILKVLAYLESRGIVKFN